VSLSDEEKLEKLIYELNLKKFDYNRKELTSVRVRAHQILAFCLIISSIIVGILSTDAITKILSFGSMTALLATGFTLLIITMAKCWIIMTKGFEDPLLDPEATYKTFMKNDFSKTMNEFRESIFIRHKETDKRNLEVKEDMGEIYEIAPISISMTFIPIIASIFL